MKFPALAALVVFSVLALGAQAQSGTIRGTVRDSAGRALPGLTVTATNVTGTVATVITNEIGVYTFSILSTGTYTLNASMPGFAPRRVNVVIGPSSSIQQDFTLTFEQIPSPFDRSAKVDILADRQSRNGVVTNYRGNVQMTTESSIIEADELDFNSQTQRADVRGNVSVQLRQIGPKVIPLYR